MAFPLDVTVQGQALNDFGFEALNTIAGLGLNTFGFLWPCDAIWSSAQDAITTTWIGCDTNNPANTVETCTD